MILPMQKKKIIIKIIRSDEHRQQVFDRCFDRARNTENSTDIGSRRRAYLQVFSLSVSIRFRRGYSIRTRRYVCKNATGLQLPSGRNIKESIPAILLVHPYLFFIGYKTRYSFSVFVSWQNNVILLLCKIGSPIYSSNDNRPSKLSMDDLLDVNITL